MNDPSKLLKIENLYVSFDTPKGIVRAVSGVNLDISPGECVAIVGESGSGKTQIFRSILGLSGRKATISGRAEFEGVDLIASSKKTLRGLLGNTITMVFQDPLSSFNPYIRMSVQMTEMLMTHKKISAKDAEGLCVEMMRRMHIPNAHKRLHMYPHEFSGGMRQRMMIAMALLPYPKLVIADEPTTALDVTLQEQVLKIIRQYRRDFNASIIFITHDLGVATSVADRVVILYGGQVKEIGPVGKILNHPAHPYTKGLLKSIPSIHGEISELIPIPGKPANLGSLPPGCAFSERCPHVFERCRTTKPPLSIFEPDHYRACFLESIDE